MAKIIELDRDGLRSYLGALRIQRSMLPIVGIVETKEGEDGELKREYFALTENKYGSVDIGSYDIKRILTMTLCGEIPGIYNKYSYNFHQEAEVSETFVTPNERERKDLQSLLD